jgi:tetratricopeptide (TPR) repeat protein
MELVPMKLRLANALVSYVKYIEKMIWPKSLAVFYPFPDTLPVWQILGGGLFLASISFLVLLNFRKKPYLCIGWLWFLGTLIPVIGLKQAGLWPAMADRWAYVPLIGIFIIIAWGISDLASKWRHKKIGLALAAVLLLILMTVTWLQVRYWINSVSLFKHAFEVTDDNFIIHFKLGESLAEQGRTEEAIIHYQEVLRLNPCYALAHHNLGCILVDQGRTNEAMNHYIAALKINPKLERTHINLGCILNSKGKRDKAIKHYFDALRLNNKCAEAYNNIGVILALKGKFNVAIVFFQNALQIKPDCPEAQNNLKNALKLLRKT